MSQFGAKAAAELRGASDTMPVDPQARNEPVKRPPAKPGQMETDQVNATAVVEVVNGMLDEYESGRQLLGISTGYPSLDEILGGWQRSRLYVVGARTRTGKSVFALNSALRVASAKEPVAYLTPEMPAKHQFKRALYCWAQVPEYRVRHHTMGPGHWGRMVDAANNIARMNLVFDENPRPTIDQVETKLRAFRAQGVRLAFLDHGLRLAVTGRQTIRESVVDRMVRFKALVNELDMSLVVLWQLTRECDSRQVKDHRPHLTDLQESGSVEQEADCVILLHRADMLREAEEWDNKIDLIVAKHRDGQPGTVTLNFDGPMTHISEPSGSDLGIPATNPASYHETERDAGL